MRFASWFAWAAAFFLLVMEVVRTVVGSDDTNDQVVLIFPLALLALGLWSLAEIWKELAFRNE